MKRVILAGWNDSIGVDIKDIKECLRQCKKDKERYPRASKMKVDEKIKYLREGEQCYTISDTTTQQVIMKISENDNIIEVRNRIKKAAAQS